MEIDRRGQVVCHEFHDGVINSTERMTYNAVNGILTDRDPELMARYASLVPMFEQMRELFQILNEARRRRGSIDFDLNEAEVIIDEGGAREAKGRTKGDSPQIDGAVHIAARRPLRAGDIVTVRIDRADAYDLWGTAA